MSKNDLIKRLAELEHIQLKLTMVLVLVLVVQCSARPEPVPEAVPVAQKISVLVSPDWPQEDPGTGKVLVICQLHKGGSEGLVDLQLRRIAWGGALRVFWETDALEDGWYETFCQLSQGNRMLTPLVDSRAQRIQSHQYAYLGHFLKETEEHLIYLPRILVGETGR